MTASQIKMAPAGAILNGPGIKERTWQEPLARHLAF